MKINILTFGFFILTTLISCGGGGSSEDQSVRGIVRDSSGKTLENVKVNVQGDDKLYLTDTNGQFHIPTELTQNNFTLEVSKENINSEIPINLNQNTGEVNVGVVLTDSGVFDVCSVAVSNLELLAFTTCPAAIEPPEEETHCSYEDSDCGENKFCFYSDQSCGVGEGVCKSIPETCYQIYAPVCACDGTTYANDCEAIAAGQSIQSDGSC